ncbi:MetQ/NlpA family ABC transporter substrate-binding protein [Kurthia huakuii]|uniref:MetQ/NlpA family ABC transporter substrate-binding protein n=1 Tax=Kurthia huakuii TaxID=1421019 RepID=UPI000494F3F1|nr:MetQ/NlpA family ABC transporter substrate-binding protein [Kurthia huakuii]MBM7700243.1 D-methionine transport system substrate-binding protein [Kurthia huakuii]
MKASKKLVASLLTASLALSLAACGSDDKEKSGGDANDTTLKIMASNTPHQEILKKAEPILEKEGVDLEIETAQDYVIPNKALASGDIDANYFQHIPYLEQQMKDNKDYDFVNAGGIHIEPIAIYSKQYKSLEDLPKGAKIVISKSVADQGRILTLLEANGLIKLKDGVDKTTAEIKDIAENPKDLKIDPAVNPEMLVQTYNNSKDVDAVVINSNFAIDAGLNPKKDSIAIEDDESPYVNVIAVRKDDKDSEAIKKLVDVLHSEEIQQFITDEWGGSVVPVSK